MCHHFKEWTRGLCNSSWPGVRIEGSVVVVEQISLCVPVFSADALVQPHAMVVVFLHTSLAVAAVLRANRTHRLAGVTDIEDRVVDVPIVPPGCGVTNLLGREENKG